MVTQREMSCCDSQMQCCLERADLIIEQEFCFEAVTEILTVSVRGSVSVSASNGIQPFHFLL